MIRSLRKALNQPYLLDFSLESIFAHFSCIEKCIECCSYTYFLPDEISSLSNKIYQQLTITDDGKYEVQRTEGRCVFFDETGPYLCTIHNHRPLRCRIYPLFPVIVNDRIVITFEPALKMLDQDGVGNNCPGFGRTTQSILPLVRDCLKFVKCLEKVPDLLATIVLSDQAFNLIRRDRWFIETEIKMI